MSLNDISYLRTPNECFADITDFPYQVQYLQHGSLRMAYVDERSHSEPQETFLCLHGQPTWSYLFRRMIPVFLNFTTRGSTEAVKRRVVAPDFFGFGRSDKPTQESVYTYSFHRESLLYFIQKLDLRNVTLVVQDWGGLLGLTLPQAEPWRYKRLIVMNTTVAIGHVPSIGFSDWRAFSNRNPDLQIGGLMGRSTKHLTIAEREAYDAPYPSTRYKAGVRRFPNLVMTQADMDGVEISKAALNFYSTTTIFGPHDIFMACGMKDPVFGPPVMTDLSKKWRDGCLYIIVADAGHFVQEWGDMIAQRAIACFESGSAIIGVELIRPPRERL
ncbi:hypothetical protein LTR86_011039 [Recurvomyces mirabilis]|nr:hypothetical protein LTR86_011039 [Recurvomyces mirabilis]